MLRTYHEYQVGKIFLSERNISTLENMFRLLITEMKKDKGLGKPVKHSVKRFIKMFDDV